MPREERFTLLTWERPLLVSLAGTEKSANGGNAAYIEDGSNGTYKS